MNHRLVGAIVSILLIAMTVEPVIRDPRKAADDDFPLSTYPMFATRRKLTQTFTYAVAWTADGERRRVRPRHVANAEVMQAVTAFGHAQAEGRLPALCDSIAARVAADAALTDVARIEIVRGTHHALDFLVDGKRGPERRLVECAVPR